MSTSALLFSDKKSRYKNWTFLKDNDDVLFSKIMAANVILSIPITLIEGKLPTIVSDNSYQKEITAIIYAKMLYRVLINDYFDIEFT